MSDADPDADHAPDADDEVFGDPLVFAPLPGLSLILDADEDDDFVVTAIEPGVSSNEWIFDDPIVAASHLGALGERVMDAAPILEPPSEGASIDEPVTVRPLAEIHLDGVDLAILRFAIDAFVVAGEEWDDDDWIGLPSFTSAVVTAVTIAIETAVEAALSVTGAGSLDDVDLRELAELAGLDLDALDSLELSDPGELDPRDLDSGDVGPRDLGPRDLGPGDLGPGDLAPGD